MIKTFSKHSIARVAEDFCAYEFDCPCGRMTCDKTYISMSLVEKLQKMRDITGFPITITSGTRCTPHQNDLRAQGEETSVGPSSHESGLAADCVCGAFSGDQLAEIARKVGFKNIGIGKRKIHVDEREGGPREWRYSK